MSAAIELDQAPRRWSGALDDLLELDSEELAELYRNASTPTIAELDGDYRGRMLAVPPAGRALQALSRQWAGSDYFFVWQGKSFQPLADEVGRGVNRLLVDRLHRYPFLTRVKPSAFGEFDAVELDYDLPENPFFIRAIRDEIRRLDDGLYLGQAYVRLGGSEQLVLYFGLQHPDRQP